MSIPLTDGCRVGVVGGGPAGSLFSYFLLTFADRLDLDVSLDIYEPRDFTRPGPGGCNMCGGIVSESLVQMLAVEGINLPPAIVQRGIDSYVLHTDESRTKIDTPLKEKRIAAIHRGGGPRDVKEIRWGGLDGHLLGLAREKGARVIPARVSDAAWDDGRPSVQAGEDSATYDLLVGATGVNSSGWDLFEKLGFRSRRPRTTKTYITEINLGFDKISAGFGNAMHVFLLNIPHLDCAAIIPKGDFLTVCLLGQDIDKELIAQFFDSPAVRRCFPAEWAPGQGACHCQPKINIREASQPFLDRVVLIGDCGATRLYKDGIGAAYRTAKAAARTAAFAGVSAGEFKRHYRPAYRAITRDNFYGSTVFAVTHIIKAMRPLLRGAISMTEKEQERDGGSRRMSLVLWDMFTGSAAYREIFFRTLSPFFLGRFAWESAFSIRNGHPGKEE